MADQADQVKPWTIKGIGPEARNAAIAAADREKQTLGEWITRAIRSQVQSDHQQSRAPAVVGPAAPPRADLAEVERVVSMAAQLAAAGAPPPKAVSRAAYALLKSALADMRGPTDARPGPTKRAVGPTVDESTEISPTMAQSMADIDAMAAFAREHAGGPTEDV